MKNIIHLTMICLVCVSWILFWKTDDDFRFWLRHRHLILRIRCWWKNMRRFREGQQGFYCTICGRSY